MKFRAFSLFIVAAIALTACKNNDNELPQPDDSNGIIKMGLNTDSLYFGINTSTKAEPSLAPADFKIHLENTKAEQLAQWPSFAEVPGVVKMVFGSYKLVASYGDINALPKFDSPVYGAETKFALSSEQPVVDVTLACRPLATKVSVKFSDTFANGYSSYEVDVKTVGDSLKHTAADINREAYFKPGILRFKFTLVRKAEPEKEYEYYYSTNIKTKAAEYYKVTFNAINTSGQLGITVTTDNTTIEQTIEKELPEFWLPRPAPVVMQHSFGETKELTTTEAISVAANAVIKTYAGITKAVIKTTSAELLAKGYPAEGVDIMKGAELAYSEKIAFLKNLGVTWSKVLDDKEKALALASNSPVVIDFMGATKNLNTEKGVTTAHGFEVILTDKFDQTHEPLVFTLKVAPPVLSLVDMSDASLWAKHAFMNCNYRSDRDGYRPIPQISKDNGATWEAPKYELISDNNEVRAFCLNELTPSTSYKFRVILGKHSAEHPDALTTEADAQVENNSFEDWHMDYKKVNLGYRIPLYYPWKSDAAQYWNTGNERGLTYGVVSNQYTHASATMYTYNAKTGTKAAEIRTVSANGGTVPVNSVGVDEISNRTRGRLLIGSYSYSSGSFADNINYGRNFASRPTKMTFWYQYKPVNADGDTFQAVVKVWYQNGAEKTPLGEATFTKNIKEAIGAYQLAEVPITYTNTSKRATHVTVEFVSTTDQTPRTNKNVKTTYPDVYDPSNWHGHIGSILLVDDVQMIY